MHSLEKRFQKSSEPRFHFKNPASFGKQFSFYAALFVLAFAALLTSFASANPGPGLCGTLDGNYTMNVSAASTTTCFTVGAHNIVLDCQGNTIYYKNATGGTAYYGIYDPSYQNLTVKNCAIIANVTGGTSHGIWLYNGASGANLTNNTIFTYSGYGVYVQLSSNDVSITNSNITSDNTVALYVYDSTGVRITNNRQIKGNAHSGIYLDHYASATVMENNTITGGNSTVGNYGIYLNDATNNVIVRNNTIYSRAYGLYFNNYVDGSIIANNNITSRTNTAVYATTYVTNNVFANNTIMGGVSNSYGVVLSGSCSGNNFTNNTINTTGYDAVYATTYSSNNLIYNNTLNTTRYGIQITTQTNNWNISNNAIYVQGVTSGSPNGIILGNNVDGATIDSNNITVNGIYYYVYGIQLGTNLNNIRINANNIAVNLSNPSYYYADGILSGNNINGLTISANNISVAGRYYYNYGIQLGSNLNNVAINANNITVNGSSYYNYGIVLGISTNTNATNNNVFVYGINAYGCGLCLTAVTGLRFENNTLVHMMSHGVTLSTSSNDNYFLNNTIISGNVNGYYGLTLSASTGNQFYNNTIIGTNDAAIYLTTGANDNFFYYNNVTGNASNAEGIVDTYSDNNSFYYNNITAWWQLGLQIDNSKYNTAYGNTIFSNRSNALYFSGNSQWNTVNYCNLSVGRNGVNALYMDTATNNYFYNTNYTSYVNPAINLISYPQYNYFENGTAISWSSYGGYLTNNPTGNVFTNVNFSSNNSYGLRLNNNAFGNVFRNCNISCNTTNYALYIDSNDDNNTFDGGAIRAFNGSAIYITGGTTDVRFYNLNISAGNASARYGLVIDTNSNATLTNVSINAPWDNDFRLNSHSAIACTNCSFQEADVTFSDGLSMVNVSWLVRLHTINPFFQGVEEANFTVKESYAGSIEYTGFTHYDGWSDYFPVLEYSRVSMGGYTYYENPANFTASMGGASNYTTDRVSDNKIETINLNASTCGALSSNTVLRNNVYASGTCFTPTVAGLTLDCAGYTINYSRLSIGYAFNATRYGNATIKNCKIVQDAANSSSHAFFFYNSSGNTLWNSTITTIDAKSFFLTSNADDYAISTTFNKSNSQFNDTLSSLNVSWYLNASVKTPAGSPVENARLLVYDAFSALRVNETSDSNGLIPTQILTEYVQNSSDTAYYTNYVLNASKGSVSNTTSVNLTANASIPVILNATLCGTLSSNLVLSNDVESSGTCFTFAANGVMLDCAGYAISYSRSVTGYAADITGFNAAQIRNCRIIQGGTDASSPAVYAESTNNSLIANSTIAANGAAYDYYFTQSHDNALLNSTYNDARIFIDAASGNLSVYWFLTMNVIGLANEIVPSAPITILNAFGNSVFSGLTDANGTAFTVLRGWVKDFAGVTNETPHNVTATHPETNYATSQNYSVDSTKSITITVISASVNITSPAFGTVFFQGQTAPIYVNESKGIGWITNVTVSVLGDDVNREWQATEISSNYWNYNYSIDPAMSSRVLTIHARGYNGTTYVSQNSTIVVTRSTGGGIEQPLITHLFANHTYVVAGENTTINATADLDTVIYAMVVNVTYPDNSSVVLTPYASSSNETTYVYSYLYEINATQTGTYVISATARDVNDNPASATQYFYAAASADSIYFTGSGVTTYYLKDVYSDAVIAVGENATVNASLPAGKYNLVAETATPRITLYNASINASVTGNALAYVDPGLESVEPPVDRRNIALFQVTSGGIEYGLAGVYYNYSAIAGSLVAEASLEMRKCVSVSDCNWTDIAYTLHIITNEINGSDAASNGIWAVFEPAFTEPEKIYVNTTIYEQLPGTTNTVVQEKPVYVNVYVPTEVPKYVSVNIIENPGATEMYSEDSKTIDVKIRNNEEFALDGISMSAEIDAPGVTAAFDNPAAGSLAPGEEKTVTLRLTAQGATEGDYNLKIKAFIASKNIEDSANAPVHIVKYSTVDKTAAQEAIDFARQLLSENPECAELSKNIEIAQQQLDEGDVAGATERGKKIVEACKGTLNLLSEEKTSKPITGLVAANALDNNSGGSNDFVMIGVGMAVTLTAVFAYNFYQKRRNRGLNQ